MAASPACAHVQMGNMPKLSMASGVAPLLHGLPPRLQMFAGLGPGLRHLITARDACRIRADIQGPGDGRSEAVQGPGVQL